MDLVGIETKRTNALAPVIILTRLERKPFTRQEVSALTNNLKPVACVSGNRKYPSILLIEGGEWSEQAIAQVLGHSGFDYKLVHGLDNPELPFKPSML